MLRNARMLLAIAILLLLSACGHSTDGARYVVEGLQVFYIHPDGTREPGPNYQDDRTLTADNTVRVVGWNDECVLLETWVSSRSMHSHTTSGFWSLDVWSPDMTWVDGRGSEAEGFALFMQEFLAVDPNPEPLYYRQPVLSGRWVAALYDGGEEPLLALYDLKSLKAPEFSAEREVSLSALSGTTSACISLAGAPDGTLELSFADGTQVRFDPSTCCQLSAEEPVPEPLQAELPEVEGWSISGDVLLQNGSAVCSLPEALSQPIPKYFDLEGGSAGWAKETLGQVRILGATDEIVVLEAQRESNLLAWPYADEGGERYVFFLSAVDGKAVFRGGTNKWRFFVVDGEIYALCHTLTDENPYENGWHGAANAWTYRRDGLQWQLYRIDPYDVYGFDAEQDDLMRTAFGELHCTGAAISYGGKLIFACVDGSIRSYCPKTEEVSILLEPDESRGCIWKFGLQGSTLCWYELFQQGGQMHTLELE